MTPPIGHSTGWLSTRNVCTSLTEHAMTIREAGGDAMEIFWKHPVVRDTAAFETWRKDFRHVSLHLASFEDSTSKEDLVAEFDAIAAYGSTLQTRATVVHPQYCTDELYTLMRERRIPVTVENMDRRQTSGYSLEELLFLRQKHNVMFCLDLQHAYERSVDAKLHNDAFCKAYVAMMLEGGRLSVLHVSGETTDASGVQQQSHTSLHHATNREEIVYALRSVLRQAEVPIILEGDYLAHLPTNFTPASEADAHDICRRAMATMREERAWLCRELAK